MAAQLESSERRLDSMEDKTIPTEEDTIREMILRTSKTEGELQKEKEKASRLNAQVEFLQKDLK